MRRRKLLVVLAGLAVGVAAGLVVLWPRSASRITRENFNHIQIGMSRADVEAFLGPPGDYRTGLGEIGEVVDTQNMLWVPDVIDSTLPNWSRNPGQSPEDPRRWANWLSDWFVILIVIDDSGQVVQKQLDPRRTTQGLLDNLLWRAKRQWHRWFP